MRVASGSFSVTGDQPKHNAMQSILISSKDKEKGKDKAIEISKKRGIDDIDINIFEFEKAVGIDDIRSIQQKIFLKPIRSLEKSALLMAFQGLTIEAQNSMLKLLEEPPNNTIVILVVSDKESLLPTILSRCVVIELESELKVHKNTSAYLNILISPNGVGERLKIAQDLSKEKEEALGFLENLIIAARKKLIQDINKNDLNHLSKKKSLISLYLNILISLQRTHTVIKTTNVNLRLALENLFLNL